MTDKQILAYYLSRQHLWPEERREVHRLSESLGIKVSWFTLKFGDPTARPVRTTFEALEGARQE